MSSNQEIGAYGLTGGPLQAGFTLPNRIWATRRYLDPLRIQVAEKRKAGEICLEPVVKNFKDWVTNHSVYRMWVVSMLNESNEWINNLHDIDIEDFYKGGTTKKSGKKDRDFILTGVSSYDEFFELINETITNSPGFTNLGLVSTPLLGVFFVMMGTKSGMALFYDALFNKQVKKVLDAWNTFLKSSASLDKLDINDKEKEGSWLSVDAFKAGVWKDIDYDAKAPAFGFDSWNSFFIRTFIPGRRPFNGDERDTVFLATESTPWNYANNLSFQDSFWIKDMPYSLLDLFGGNRKYARMFECGELYQGFLSAMHYHRWNSPLTGKIVHSWVEPGTYFAIRPADNDRLSKFEGLQSQPFLGHVAARAIFIYYHEKFGYVALICIGMVEVSSCVISPSKYIVQECDDSVDVEKGDEIGHFEFGGSTHILFFQKDSVALEDWAINAKDHRRDGDPKKLGSILGKALN